MKVLAKLFDNNRAWAEKIVRDDPDFFSRSSETQLPDYLWIGCSDSRVPANQIVGLLPGELFVHRNIANIVVHSDLNCLSVMQFAVDILKVKHIIVVGHYGCSGVRAALRNDRVGLADNWLRHIQDVRDKHQHRLDAFDNEDAKHNRLCELNVIEQVANVCMTTIARDAWERRQELTVHGWCYGIKDGLTHDMNISVAGPEEAATAYEAALAGLP
jgi:carbonic anhydrase